MSNTNTPASNPYARNLTYVKNYFKKPLTAVVGLLAIVQLIVVMVYNSSVQAALQDLYTLFGGSAEDVSSGGLTYALNYIILGIVALCIILIFVMSLSSSPVNPSPCFSTLHILSVIQLIANVLTTIFLVIVAVVFLAMGSAMFDSVLEALPTLAEDENFATTVDAYKVSIIVVMAIMIVFYVMRLIYINSQTAFLKSCQRSCKEPGLLNKGAKRYSTFCYIGVIAALVLFVIGYLLSSDIIEAVQDYDGISSFISSIIAYLVVIVLNLLFKGLVAGGYYKHIENYESFAASAAAGRAPEVNPIPTYKSNSRKVDLSGVHQQSQPYLYGIEEDPDPNKKSAYIPEELQGDPNEYDESNPYGQPIQYDPSYSQQNPYGQPVDPYGQPIQQPPVDPYGQPVANPYNQPMQNPNNQNPYNNGMM